MREYYVEFDLVESGYADGYYYAATVGQAKQQAREELIAWGGGHADIYYNGDFVDDVEA